MRPEGIEQTGDGTVRAPTEILPGAAEEPKAEWELQLEAEEEAEKAARGSAETGADGTKKQGKKEKTEDA